MSWFFEAIHNTLSRRSLFKGLGSLAAISFWGSTASAGLPLRRPTRAPIRSRTRAVLLGTAGGPTWWPDCNRFGTSTAIVVADSLYLIDLGQGATHRLAQAFNVGNYQNTPGGPVQLGYSSYLRAARALFFTHLHMDHTADYPALLLCGIGAGLNPQRPLEVFGPGNRGMLEPVFGNRPEPPIVNPENPTPGTTEMTQSLFQAYAQTINNFMRDNAWPDFRTVVNPHDIQLPFLIENPNATPAPEMKPFILYEDDLVRVHATLVNHQPVFPAFAFRFDTADGAIVISGDTGPCQNLIRLAQGANVLIHEVIDETFIDLLFPDPTDPSAASLINHLKSAHTTIDAVGSIAQAAGVQTLVLNHLVPGNMPIHHLLRVRNHFSGQFLIGEDLLEIPVG